MNPPSLPIRDSSETLAWLQLTLMPGLRPSAQRKLLRVLKSPARVLAAPEVLTSRIVDAESAARLAQGPQAALVDRALAWLAEENNHLVALGDPAYPRALLEMPDPPNVLYATGRIELLNAPSIAIVGSRNATPQGARDAESFAHALSAAGLCVVSGLALGIDAHAHRGGLDGGASSVAVMGTGADRVYPTRNRDLAQRLAREGCLVTEFPLGTPPEAGNFPRRNRLISGLACGVLVVEAAEESGSLITARLAAEQNRDVFAIPGSIHSSLAKGCHRLIKEGAKLVESADDVLVELNFTVRAPVKAATAIAEGAEEAILQAMGFAPRTIDEIVGLTGAAVAAVGAELTRLQLEGHVVPLAGGSFQRVARAL